MSDPKPPIKIDESSLEQAPNDTGLPAKVVLDKLTADGVTLHYGDIALLVQRSDYEIIKKQVAEKNRDQRQDIMASVESALTAALPMVRDGTANKSIFDAFYADLMIWNAIKGDQQ